MYMPISSCHNDVLGCHLFQIIVAVFFNLGQFCLQKFNLECGDRSGGSSQSNPSYHKLSFSFLCRGESWSGVDPLGSSPICKIVLNTRLLKCHCYNFVHENVGK
jgi:hypothetical protein